MMTTQTAPYLPNPCSCSGCVSGSRRTGRFFYLTVTHLTGEDVTCLAPRGARVLSSAYASVGTFSRAFGALGYFVASAWQRLLLSVRTRPDVSDSGSRGMLLTSSGAYVQLLSFTLFALLPLIAVDFITLRYCAAVFHRKKLESW